MIIPNLGAAMAHWLGFQEKIGRSFMMNEDALKYPLADYLVNGGGISLKSIVLERPHPNFANRLVDLAIVGAVTTQIDNMFEPPLILVFRRTCPSERAGTWINLDIFL